MYVLKNYSLDKTANHNVKVRVVCMWVQKMMSCVGAFTGFFVNPPAGSSETALNGNEISFGDLLRPALWEMTRQQRLPVLNREDTYPVSVARIQSICIIHKPSLFVVPSSNFKEVFSDIREGPTERNFDRSRVTVGG